eukprot:scaffold117767_cov15-Tisochrysis_lutea.AAC.1
MLFNALLSIMIPDRGANTTLSDAIKGSRRVLLTQKARQIACSCISFLGACHMVLCCAVPAGDWVGLGAEGSTSTNACEQGPDNAKEAALHYWAAWTTIHKDEYCEARLGAGTESPALATGCDLVQQMLG